MKDFEAAISQTEKVGRLLLSPEAYADGEEIAIRKTLSKGIEEGIRKANNRLI